eukprot:COSAG06_NODE_5648_length_3342_cov_1.867407_2_plen_200_part_00
MASDPGAQAQDDAQAFTTTPVFDVYAAYGSMSGELVAVNISSSSTSSSTSSADGQTAPFDALATIDLNVKPTSSTVAATTATAAAWILLGQAQNETGPFSGSAYNASVVVTGLGTGAATAHALVRDGKINVTIGGANGKYPLDHQHGVAATTVTVSAAGEIEIRPIGGGGGGGGGGGSGAMSLGGPHANDWYFIKLNAP